MYAELAAARKGVRGESNHVQRRVRQGIEGKRSSRVCRRIDWFHSGLHCRQGERDKTDAYSGHTQRETNSEKADCQPRCKEGSQETGGCSERETEVPYEAAPDRTTVKKGRPGMTLTVNNQHSNALRVTNLSSIAPRSASGRELKYATELHTFGHPHGIASGNSYLSIVLSPNLTRISGRPSGRDARLAAPA